MATFPAPPRVWRGVRVWSAAVSNFAEELGEPPGGIAVQMGYEMVYRCGERTDHLLFAGSVQLFGQLDEPQPPAAEKPRE